MIVIAAFLRKLQAVKDKVRPLSKNNVSEHPLKVNMLKRPKHL